MSTYQERQAYRDSHPGAVVDNNSSSDGGFHSDTPNGTPSSGGGGGGGGGGDSGGGSPAPAAPSGGGGGAATFNTTNGQQTIASMAGQLQAVGWTGNPNDPAAVQAAYASTTHGAVTPLSAGDGGGGGGGGSGGGGGGSSGTATSADLGRIQQSILNAIGSGNAAAAAEAAKEFQQTFGLDTDKFNESIRQYNQNLVLAQQNFALSQQSEANKTGLAALTLASTNQADPFRRLSTQYAIGQNPAYMAGINNVIQGVTTPNGVAQFQAPGASAADSATLQGLAGSIAATQNGAGAITAQNAMPGQYVPPNGYATGNYGTPSGFTAGSYQVPPYTQTTGTGGSTVYAQGGAGAGGTDPTLGTYAQGQATLAALPANNQTIARVFNQLGPSAQTTYLSAQSAKTGMDPADLKAQIQATLPKFTSPAFGLAAA